VHDRVAYRLACPRPCGDSAAERERAERDSTRGPKRLGPSDAVLARLQLEMRDEEVRVHERVSGAKLPCDAATPPQVPERMPGGLVLGTPSTAVAPRHSAAEQAAAAEALQVPPSPMVALWSGGLAGMMIDCLLYPVDTLKTRAIQGVPFRPGDVFSLWNGLGAALLPAVPAAGVFFFTCARGANHTDALGNLYPP